jgi:hypothetical protein
MANHKPPVWRRRAYQISAAMVVLLVVAALGANFYLAQQYQPAGAVSAYLTALHAKDADAAWNAVLVEAPRDPADASLTDLTALRRALAQGAPDIKAFDVTATSYLDSTQASASVAVSYQTSSGTRQTTFQVVRGPERHFGIYPSWRVVIQPAIIELTLPPSVDSVLIDGRAVELSGSTSTVAVWPLRHQITFPGSALLREQSVVVDAFDSTRAEVAAQPALTAEGEAAAITAVKQAFAQCAAQTSLHPDGCPQRYDDAFAGSGSWRLIGDPSRDLAIGFDNQANLSATGHYQMLLAYQESNGTRHSAIAGGFVAQLGLGASDIAVSSLAPSTNVPALQRPSAATDQVVKTVVSKALTACAAIASADPPDCPQQFFFPDATILGWKISGDPLANATITYDATSGLFDVHGAFSMTVSYEITTYPETRSSSTTTYDATVLWDGSQPQVVTISGGYQ